MIARLKEEQKRKLAKLTADYDSTVAALITDQNMKLEEWQEEELTKLKVCSLLDFGPYSRAQPGLDFEVRYWFSVERKSLSVIFFVLMTPPRQGIEGRKKRYR